MLNNKQVLFIAVISSGITYLIMGEKE